VPLQIVMLNTTQQKMEVVKSMDDMIEAMNLTGQQKVVSYSPDYVPWFTDEVLNTQYIFSTNIIRPLTISLGPP